MCANSEGSGETARITVRLCDKELAHFLIVLASLLLPTLVNKYQGSKAPVH